MASKERNRIVQVTGVGLASNVALSALKIGVGSACASQTLVADGVHSFSDAATDIAVIVGSRFWSAPSDEEHPYGHRRIETIVTLFIGLSLMMVGFNIVVHSVGLFVRGDFAPPPGFAAILVALLSIGLKEYLYRWTNAEGKRLQSSALVANAWHHRSDALSSLPALFALVAANVRPDWTFVDMLGAVLVSLFIFRSAVAIAWPCLQELGDSAAPRPVTLLVGDALRSVEGVEQVHQLRTRRVGSSLYCDVHIVVDGDLTVRDGHRIADAARDAVLEEVPSVIEVLVHVDPDDDSERDSRGREA
ncbi:MAG: cation transporter [Fibrobacterales bacterium]|nr:cation transporter [Fibrobacterales bacterium]